MITHGNGPQVGHLLSMDEQHTHDLDAWVAATQGMIGHELSLHLNAILRRRRRPERTAVVLTHVEVDPEDEGFQWPTKPVGPCSMQKRSCQLIGTLRKPFTVLVGWSPARFLRIHEIDVIRHLVDLRAVVFAAVAGHSRRSR